MPVHTVAFHLPKLPLAINRKAQRDVASPASLGAFGQKMLLRQPNEKDVASISFVRPDADIPDEEFSSTPNKSARKVMPEDYDITLGTAQLRANNKTAPTRSALEQASFLTNDSLWNERSTTRK